MISRLLQYSEEVITRWPSDIWGSAVISSSAPSTAISRYYSANGYKPDTFTGTYVDWVMSAGTLKWEREILFQTKSVWDATLQNPILLAGLPQLTTPRGSNGFVRFSDTITSFRGKWGVQVDAITSNWSWSSVTWSTKPPTASVGNVEYYCSLTDLGTRPNDRYQINVALNFWATAMLTPRFLITDWGIPSSSIYGISVRNMPPTVYGSGSISLLGTGLRTFGLSGRYDAYEPMLSPLFMK